MGCAQDHARGLACLEGFLPARRAQAPAVARLQAGKAEFRQGSRKVIAPGFGKTQKGVAHHRADRVAADILGAGVATAVAEKASQRWCCQWDGMQSPHASLSDMVTTLYGIYGIICQVAGTFLKTHHLGIDAHEKVSAGMDIC